MGGQRAKTIGLRSAIAQPTSRASWPSKRKTSGRNTASSRRTRPPSCGCWPSDTRKTSSFFGAYRGDDLLGGVVVYENRHVAHAQYIATTPEGRELSALDCVVDGLLNDVYADKVYFDFGISTEDGGKTLNIGLIDNKESYGARAVAYDWYELDVA